MKRDFVHIPMPAVAWTVAAFLVAAAPHMAAMPHWLAGTIVALTAWRLAATHWRWRAPPGWLRILLTVLAIGLVMLAFGGLWGRRTATALLCLMLGAKMLEMFRVRDLRMVASVCFFLIATQFLFSERLVYLAYLVAGSLVAVAAMVEIHRLDESGRVSSGYPDRDGPLAILRQSAIMLAAALPIALTLFVLFPRLAEPLWGLPDEVMDGRTGLSDTMSPGSIANLFPDDSPAFRAEFQGEPPPHDQRYWRGPVLWHFDGNTWQQALFLLRQPAATVPDGLRSWEYRIQLEPHERRWLFALDYPVDYPDDAHLGADFQMLSRRPITALMRYDVTSNPEFIDSPELASNQRRMALSLPEDRNPRTIERARQLRSQYPDDRDLIAAVLGWFRAEEFYYSLETTPTGRHGTDEFLFDLRTGYCEHYASAFAVLMRAAGVPTRIVTGYQGGFWQSGGQYLLVRQSDAHAWAEVWLETSGWTRVDPTAAVSPARINQGSRMAVDEARFLLDLDWLINLRNRYDRVQHLWNNWVLGFDAARQQRMMERLGLPDVSPTRTGLVMVLGLALVVLVLTFVLLVRPWRRSADPLERAWRRLRRRLHRKGAGQHIGETPLEFIGRVAARLETGRYELLELGELYCRAHYGDDPSARASFIDGVNTWRPTNRLG